MKTRTLKLRTAALLLIASLIAMLAGSGQRAFASPPDIQRFHADETFPASGMSAFCGFSITRHDVIDGQFTVRHTSNGEEIDSQIAHGTATFTANGNSLVARFGGIHLDRYYSDGYSYHMAAGEELYIVLPGVGPAWGETGGYDYTLDPDGNVIAQRGLQHFVAFSTPAVCTALAP